MRVNPKPPQSPHGTDWLGELDPKQWLLEEYKLLSQHYFHEDESLRKIIATYLTINGGLLAFVGSAAVVNKPSIHLALSVIGLVLCFAWAGTLVRIREWRGYIEERIEHIEMAVHKQWEGSEILPLDIRAELRWNQIEGRRRWYNWPYFALREVPSSVMHFVVPVTFACVWAAIAVFGI